MLELMPVKELVKELAPVGCPTVEEFVQKVKEAYLATGWIPFQEMCFADSLGRIASRQDAVGGCALGVLKKQNDNIYGSNEEAPFRYGIVNGFDGVNHLRHYKNHELYKHGYKCGEAARKAVLGR